MSEFNKLEDDAEQYAKDHPQQVHEAEQDAEHAVQNKIDPNSQQGQDTRQGSGGQQGDGAQQGQPGQDDDQGQDQSRGQG